MSTPPPYGDRMATTVLLEVTLLGPVDISRPVMAPPAVLAAVAGAKQPTDFGLSRRGDGPWRVRFHLSGPERVDAGEALEEELRALGYEVDVSFWP